MTICKSCKTKSTKTQQQNYNELANWHYQDGLGYLFGQRTKKESIKLVHSAGIAFKARHPESAKKWNAFETKVNKFISKKTS